MKKIIPVVSLLLLFACSTTRKHSGAANTKAAVHSTGSAAGICDRAVVYFSDKVVAVATGEATEMKTEIRVDPSAKTITLFSQPPGQEKVNFTTIIERAECNMNAALTEGYIEYSGYIVQEDGTSTKQMIRLEARDGGLVFFRADPDKPQQFIIYISRWELAKS